MWDALTSWERSDLDRFMREATPLIEAAAATAATTQAALVASISGSVPTYDLDAVRSSAVSKLDQPFTAAWHAAKTGRPWDEALSAGRSAAEAIGRDTPYQAARGALSTSTATGPFQRQVSGESCDWCKSFIGKRWDSASSADFGHERCDCVVVPVAS